jgi:hypothetical protein
MSERIKPPRSDDKEELRRYRRHSYKILKALQDISQADSTATTVAQLKADLNTLLATLRAL